MASRGLREPDRAMKESYHAERSCQVYVLGLFAPLGKLEAAHFISRFGVAYERDNLATGMVPLGGRAGRAV
jgi:hypothetical protein